MKTKKLNLLTMALFIVYILLLIGIILFKLPFYSPQLSDGIRIINLAPLQGSFDESGAIVWREIGYNIFIFIPFGIYLCMLKSEWTFRKKSLSVVLLSVMFEVTQFIFAMGRTDITDIINNTFGGIIGIGIYTLMFKILGNKTGKVVNIIAFVVTIYASLRFAHLFYLSHFVMIPPPL